jgi:hypothetical protein
MVSDFVDFSSCNKHQNIRVKTMSQGLWVKNLNGMVKFLIFNIKIKQFPTLYIFTLYFLFLALWTDGAVKDLVLGGFVQGF